MVLDQNVKREIIYIHTELKSWIPVLFRLYLQNWETFGKKSPTFDVSPRQIGGGGWGNLRSGDF